MSPVEIIALVIAAFAAIKLLTLMASPKAWGKIPEYIFKHTGTTMAVSLILGIVVLYYLLQEMTIVQIFATVLFTALLITMSFAAYSKEFSAMVKAILKDKSPLRRAWFPSIIWVILILWVLKEIIA